MKKWIQNLMGSWYHTFTFLWIIMIVLQWLSFASDILYAETTNLILTTITVLSLIEVLLPLRLGIKFIVKGIAVIVILYRTLYVYSFLSASGSLTDRIGEFTASMTPYIWFSLIAWLVMEAIPLMVTTKARILVFVGVNIAAFAVLDSFTPSILWDEVAWTVFAGMGWLVSKHFQSFRQSYPQGWKQIRRYPYKIVANIAVIFALVIMAGVSMPEVPPTLHDPYTVWQHLNGQTNEGATGGSILNQQMNTESGYSRQDNRLGQGFNFDYSPVMTVTTNQRSYWRGETRKVYSGTGWVDNIGSRGMLQDVGINQNLNNEQETTHSTEQVVQTVIMQNNDAYPVLFGAYSMNRVQSVNGESPMEGLRWKSSQAEMYWNSSSEKGRYPKTYTVVSHVPVIPEKKLRSKTFRALYGSNKNEEYLQIPNELPKRVRDLAENITAAAKTPYEKVGLLQQYLQRNYAYTNNPDLSRKKSRDFVDSFLFEVREGYCDYYSTSLVIMSRSLGIPARWVKGYAPGQQTFADDTANAATGDNGETMSSYTVTNADAHSWVEVYFGEYGWVPVEATPGFDMPLLTEQENSADADVPDTKDEPVQPDQKEQSASSEADPTIHLNRILVWSAAAVLILWVVYAVWRNRVPLYFYLLKLRKGKPLSADEKVVVETERWLRYLRQKGLERGRSETLRESVNKWEADIPQLSSSLVPLLELFEKARYSPSSVTDSDWQTVRYYAIQLRKGIRSAETD